MASKFTSTEIEALKGTEIVYVFNKSNGPILDGKSTYAYVAQADVSKGITIMGAPPDGTAHEFGAKEGIDVVLSCCTVSSRNTEAENDNLLGHYMDNIRNGVFNIPFTTVEGKSSISKGGGATHMATQCAF